MTDRHYTFDCCTNETVCLVTSTDVAVRLSDILSIALCVICGGRKRLKSDVYIYSDASADVTRRVSCFSLLLVGLELCRRIADSKMTGISIYTTVDAIHTYILLIGLDWSPLQVGLREVVRTADQSG